MCVLKRFGARPIIPESPRPVSIYSLQSTQTANDQVGLLYSLAAILIKTVVDVSYRSLLGFVCELLLFKNVWVGLREVAQPRISCC